MSLYGHRSYYQIILDPREGEFGMAPEVQIDHSRISMMIEDHLHLMDTMQSSNVPWSGGPDNDIESLADDQHDELAEAEATNSLWDTVHMHNKARHSTPSEESVASTVMTRVSNIIQIAYIPGVTNRSTTEMQGPLLDKPLPSLPSLYPYRAKAIYSYDADPDDPNELSFKKYDYLEISGLEARWWNARNQMHKTGIVPSNYLILL